MYVCKCVFVYVCVFSYLPSEGCSNVFTADFTTLYSRKREEVVIKTRFSTFILNLKAKAREFFFSFYFNVMSMKCYICGKTIGEKKMYGTRFVAHGFSSSFILSFFLSSRVLFLTLSFCSDKRCFWQHEILLRKSILNGI